MFEGPKVQGSQATAFPGLVVPFQVLRWSALADGVSPIELLLRYVWAFIGGSGPRQIQTSTSGGVRLITVAVGSSPFLICTEGGWLTTFRLRATEAVSQPFPGCWLDCGSSLSASGISGNECQSILGETQPDVFMVYNLFSAAGQMADPVDGMADSNDLPIDVPPGLECPFHSRCKDNDRVATCSSPLRSSLRSSLLRRSLFCCASFTLCICLNASRAPAQIRAIAATLSSSSS